MWSDSGRLPWCGEKEEGRKEQRKSRGLAPDFHFPPSAFEKFLYLSILTVLGLSSFHTLSFFLTMTTNAREFGIEMVSMFQYKR
jgi:hypothetical protein